MHKTENKISTMSLHFFFFFLHIVACSCGILKVLFTVCLKQFLKAKNELILVIFSMFLPVYNLQY